MENEAVLTSKLTQMQRQPFGVLEDGSPVNDINGNLITAPIDYMQSVLAERTKKDFPQGLSEAEQQRRIAADFADALARLVGMLNAAIPDERYHVTGKYILDDSNNYTLEFWLFVVDYCRVISGDPDFYTNYSRGRVPAVVAALFRPLSTQNVFQLMPSIVRKLSNSDVRAVEVTPTSARMRWYGYRQEDPFLNEIHLKISSSTHVNIYTSIPETVHRRKPARVQEICSMLDGHDYYEWVFTWDLDDNVGKNWLWAGILLSVALIIYYVGNLPGANILVPLGAVFPAFAGWSMQRYRKSEYERHQKETLLDEQRTLSEEQYDSSQHVKAELQSLNLELRQKIDEFTALYEIGVAISSTLDLDELLETILTAVTNYLHFDRAMVMLVDEERGILGRGHGVGDDSKKIALVKQLEIPLEDTDNYFITLLNSDRPILIKGASETTTEVNRRLLETFGAAEHLGTPLIIKGRRVGILDMDNSVSKRPIMEEEIDLIFNVASQIAVAIDNASLYKEVESQKQTLEERVKQRTYELAEATREAQEARTVAEQANEAKSTFLANMSHELRTPLNAILGFTQVMERDPELQPSQKENLDIILRSGNHLLGLINDVLEMSRIESGRVELNKGSFDLYHVLGNIEEMLKGRAEKKGIDLVFDCAKDVPQYITTDEGKLRQTIINLLGNAVKFTHEGQVTLRVNVNGSGQERRLRFEVEDTGEGIAQEEMDRLFEPFSQTQSGIKSQQGTGLGLPISRQFAQLMGGDMQVRSEINKGTSFTFEIKIELASDSDVVPEIPDRKAIGLVPGQPNYRILIVEDRWENRVLLVKLLQPLGFEIKEAENGQEGVDLAAQWEPHLIFMDMRMPVMDGYEATKKIRASEKGQTVAIVAITASAFEHEHHVVLSAGCNDLIKKPFREAELFEVMEKQIGVQFIYDEDSAQSSPDTATAESPLTSDALAVLPTDWLAAFKEAINMVDKGKIIEVADQIRDQDSSIADAITTLANNYDFDHLNQLVQEA